MLLKKLYGVVTLTVGLTGATLLSKSTTRVEAAAAPAGIKNVVLVHGAFADGSGWEAVTKIHEKDGYTVSVAQQPETSCLGESSLSHIEMLPKSRNFRKSEHLTRVKHAYSQ